MIKLNDLTSSNAIIEDLDWPFDFSLERAKDDADWIQLKPSLQFTLIAGDGTGGVFLAYGSGDIETLPILHGTSEGQAGKVAANLTEFLALLMAVPYWRDLVKFSGRGKLDEIRKTAIFMESEYAADYPDVPEARKRLLSVLPIPVLDDPIKTLHDNVHSSDCTLVAEDGWEYESLFNSFTPSDNPHWR